MVSPTKQTWIIRDRKKKNQGRKRKNALKNFGSTLSHAKLFKLADLANLDN